ncbi:hypothetical protein [Desulfoplanes formicivorans]|uniref:hypothetical protein n=1 Tax=Desulfoplanes formicivorans TaxID=1592317 RepID=UPI003F771FCD
MIEHTSGKGAFFEDACPQMDCGKSAFQKTDFFENRMGERARIKHHIAYRARRNNPVVEMVLLEMTICQPVIGMQSFFKQRIPGGKQMEQALPAPFLAFR